ncbi:ubiquinone biosynthesis protein COQ9, mitochondrial [Atheta coriaria]|uniref:ubiquinone biosynthesis protein COQ9, mitochondrial n=1 Tax=Dalotia coriaria TaxID=877792 RepID=UPI0031F39354
MSLTILLASARSTLRYSCTVAAQRWCSTKDKDTNHHHEEEDAYEEEIRDKILAASLPYVKELGWSKEAIAAGACEVGYPGVTHGMFTRGGGDLVLYFQKSSNLKLVDFMKDFQCRHEEKSVPPAEFVEIACKERLSMTIPYLARWPQAIAIMTLPPNVPQALATLLTMVDDICYHAGDRSVDFTWYARRIAVAGVYKASELYLMQDKSPEYRDTWKFLNRRLTEAVQLNDLINSKRDGPNMAGKDTISAAFTTARNILGLNKT